MPTTITALEPTSAPSTIVPAALVASARAYVAAAKSERTRRAYRADWAAFEAWCASQGLNPLPASPDTVALYLAARADSGAKVATIARALVAVSQAHKAAGHASPRGAAQVQAAMQGIRRKLGVAPSQRAPVLVRDLRSMVQALPPGLLATRDAALLLLGFAGAFRRSELVALNVGDLAFGDGGLTVTVRRSKTDQEAAGRKVGVPCGGDELTCPVRAVRAWLGATSIERGAVFVGMTRHGHLTGKRLDGRDVARVVKRAAAAAGLDASRLSGHSLRAGLATAAAKAGKSERAIMAQTGHRSVSMVRRYIRDADLFSENAAAGIGL